MTQFSNYSYTDEQNSHFLRQILQFISVHKIIPTPLNYAVYYEYISGSNKALSAAIDSFIKQKRPLNTEVSTKLYNKFIFDGSYETFDKLNQDLESLIDSTKASVAETSQKASDAGESFEEQAISIASANNAEDLKNVITNAVSDAKDLAAISKSLQIELDTAKQEMEQLRTELVKVKVSASTDALTGLLNRGAFDKALNNLIEEPDPSDSCLSILDLDHFKKVNDSHGHLIGDNVLKITAKLLKKYADPHHHVARYGGEELAIVMPSTSLSKAVKISNQIREALANSRLKKKNGSESIGKITVSIGISHLKQGDTAEDLIMRADNALYQAKETGRNKVVTETVN